MTVVAYLKQEGLSEVAAVLRTKTISMIGKANNAARSNLDFKVEAENPTTNC